MINSGDHLQICVAPNTILFYTIIHISCECNGIVKVEDRDGAKMAKD